MAGTHRMLRILKLFDLARPVITPEWLMTELGVSRASVYRDLGQLTSVGLLERVAERGYVLGPMVVELDRQIRLADPLLEAAQDVLGRLAEDTGGAVLLCRFHANQVMCIHQATPVKGLTPALAVSYERGRAMPLYRGATSKIILACLPQAQLKQLLANDGSSMVAAGLPGNLAELGPLLREMREAGYCISTGEVDPDAVGFAVALRDGDHLLGSLSIVMPAPCVTVGLRKTTLSRLQSAAGRVEGRLQDQRMKARATKKMETS